MTQLNYYYLSKNQKKCQIKLSTIDFYLAFSILNI